MILNSRTINPGEPRTSVALQTRTVTQGAADVRVSLAQFSVYEG